jgi:hypothetical protein
VRPSPSEFALFARAAARRCSGSFGGLPRVRYWQAWNEPNYFRHLGPQYDTPLSQPVRPSSRLLSPDVYRPMVNAFADAVHRVHADNLVVAGGLAPFGNENAGTHVARTLPFMRRLPCMTGRNRPQPGCRKRIKFDVWTHHPYTAGGPTHHNLSPEDVSMGDLPKMGRLLRAAVKAGHVVAVESRIWNPVTSEMPFRHIRCGGWRRRSASTPGEHVFQSGMYFGCAGGPECWRPKPSLTAFRFPFVAFTSGKGVLVWGRTPFGRRGRVVIERRGATWRRVATLRSDRFGIFTRTLRTSRRGFMRARLLPASGRPAELSVPFSLKRVPDRAVNPFG